MRINQLDLNELVVVISGGGGRIGSAFAKSIVANGGKVALGDVNDNTKNLILDLGKENAFFVKADLTETKNIQNFIDLVLNKFGKIDGAIHCSYPTSNQWGTKFENLDQQLLNEDLCSQIGGAIIFSQQLIKYFIENGGGNLIHISSILGNSAPKFSHYKGTKMVSPIEYGAIKSGIISITRYLAKYCKGKNIRVNCISPGGIFSSQPKSFIDKYKSDCISKGMLDPDDVSGTMLFLLSEQSRYINGQNLIVDDGWIL